MDVSAIEGVVGQLLGRDQGWLDFYRDTIDGLEVSPDAIERVKDRESKLASAAAAECAFMSRLWEGDLEGARPLLLDVLNDVAIADAKLAGWYSVWLGMTYEMAGDIAARDIHYQRARSRLNKWVNLPYRAPIQIAGTTLVPVSLIHERLMAINDQGPQALGDYISRLKIQAAILEDTSKTSNQHEEALRSIGEILGLEASRPDNEYGMGPDVLWVDTTAKYQVAFELKTKKDAPAEYTKHEVGQSLNHLEWLAANADGNGGDGIIMVGPDGTCANNANPSDGIYFSTPKAISDLVHVFAAKVDDTRGRAANDRTAALDDLARGAEWTLLGWFRRLATKKLMQMKAN